MRGTRRCWPCVALGLLLSALLHGAAATCLLGCWDTPKVQPETWTVTELDLAAFGPLPEGGSGASSPEPTVDGRDTRADAPSPEGPSPEGPEPIADTTETLAEARLPEVEPEDSSSEAPESEDLRANAKVQEDPAPPEASTAPEVTEPTLTPPPTPARVTAPTRTRHLVPRPPPKREKVQAPRPKPQKSRTESTPAPTGPSPQAKGSGPAGGSGPETGARPSTGAAEAAYLAELQRAIARHQRYPDDARRRRKTGVVTLAFVLQGDGRIRQVQVQGSAGDSSLDAAALQALKRLDRFKPIPPAIGRQTWAMRVPIRFDLR